jgi:hypothetical protein
MNACENLKPCFDGPATKLKNLKRGRGFWKSRTVRDGQNSGIADALYNDADCKYRRYHELPVDRLIIEAAKQGLNNNEIGAMVGKTKVTVRNTLRQPWARELLIKSMKEAGQDGLKQLLKAAAEKSLNVIQSIAENATGKVKPETQLTAAINIVDRFLGRPSQTLDVNTASKPVEKMSDAELLAIANEGYVPAVALNAPSGPLCEASIEPAPDQELGKAIGSANIVLMEYQ